VKLTIFNSLKAPTFTESELPWGTLCDYLTTPPEFPDKVSCPLLKLSCFGDKRSAKDSLRHDDNVLGIWGVEGDHDRGVMSVEQAGALLAVAGISAFIYTTASHTPTAPRWRVLIPTSQYYAPEVHRELVGRANAVLQGAFSPESFALSQAYYFGKVVGVAYESRRVDGQFIDLMPITPLFPSVTGNTSGDWTLTDTPVEEWCGPTDDDDLIRRALMSKSAASAFGGRASFADLWNADVEALSKSFPGADSYDASSADAALVSHLAFWTGKHGERIRSLMLKSGLVRDKWDREDYLPRTISEICARPGDVLQDKPVEPPSTPQAVEGAPTQTTITGQTFLSTDAQRDLFAGCVYVTDHHKVLVPGGALLKPVQFKVAFGGYCMAMDNVNERTTRDAWEAFTESQVLRAPMADTICFRPDKAPGVILNDAGRTQVNTWWPADVKRKKADPSRFLAHLAKILPDTRDQTIILSYMAACVQHKGIKFQWCPVIQGAEGNGKTILSAILSEAIGQHYTHWLDAKSIVSDFNAYLANTVFLAVEELYVQEHAVEIVEKMKTIIAGGMGTSVQPKGIDSKSMRICCNLMITTNYKAAVRKTADNARRLSVFYSAQQSKADIERAGMGGNYFPDLWDWLRAEGFAIVAELLHTYQIPAEFNPAGDCRRAPDTSTTGEVIVESQGSVEQQIAEMIAQDTPGFMGGWVSSVALDRLIGDTLKMGNRISHAKRREMMQGMGYTLHPGLLDGRVNNPVQPDGRKPQLFIKAGHVSAGIVGAAEIARAYSTAQMLRVGI